MSRGSQFFSLVITLVVSTGCSARGEAGPRPGADPAAAAPRAAPRAAPGAGSGSSSAAPEACLGVHDRGIWTDLDDQVQLVLPAVEPARVSATLDRGRSLLVLSIDGFPRKAYPLSGDATLALGAHVVKVRPGDHAELSRLLSATRVREVPADRPGEHDADGDGIPDPLDLLVGAKKTVANAAAYTEGYVRMTYPMGDVPREMGVCTDVVIRAARNAGLDLQRALHDDIRRAPRAYPMVKGRGNPHIDQRRVATLLPYFKRHWQARSSKLDDPDDPLLPGDVVFMDTFPQRAGPDHIGVISDRMGDHALPLVINNWTNGTRTAEMDLLTFVPVLHRFRLPAP